MLSDVGNGHVPAGRPHLPGPFLVGGGFLEGLHDLLADAHPGGVMVGAGGGGVVGSAGDDDVSMKVSAGCAGRVAEERPLGNEHADVVGNGRSGTGVGRDGDDAGRQS